MDIWDIIDKRIDYSIKNIENEIPKKSSSKNQNRGENKKTNNEKINIILCKRGAYINVEELSYKMEKKIRNYFIIKSKNIMGYWDKTPCYFYSPKGDKIYIPRFGAFLLQKKIDNIKITNSIKTGKAISTIKWNGSFKGNQELIHNHIMKKIFNKNQTNMGKSGFILNLEAGQGKTFVAMSLIDKLKCKTLIVVHNSTILFQWVKLLEEYFPKITVGLYYGKKKTNGDIIVGIINSLLKDTIELPGLKFSSKEFYSTIGFCIFDECHEYCSKGRSKIFRNCQTQYMLGLSATPNEREDGLDKIPQWNIGPILTANKIKGYTEIGISFKGRVTAIKYYGPSDFTKTILNEKLEMTSVPLMIEQLTKDKYRLRLIINHIIDNFNKNLNIFVFADRRSYLEKINKELNSIKILADWMTNDDEYKNIENTVIMGGCLSEHMDYAREKANIILSTYQFISTGTSIPKMNCVILATPRKSKSRQIINRIFRLGSDHSIERQIIDIIDWKTSLKNQWYKRKEYYKEKDYIIDEVKVKYDDIILN